MVDAGGSAAGATPAHAQGNSVSFWNLWVDIFKLGIGISILYSKTDSFCTVASTSGNHIRSRYKQRNHAWGYLGILIIGKHRTVAS
jgi:hypothetical protein